jgi:murein DD-endopeptidase MepM/ murein hydrolase activator NlpD
MRKHDVHLGVDLYAPEGHPVVAMEDGEVVAVVDFTGPDAGCDWWLPTRAVLVEGASGVLLYGEVIEAVPVGTRVTEGDVVGHVKRVLRHDKGRPTAMLHLELYTSGTRNCCELQERDIPFPDNILDPTPLLKPFVSPH